MKHLKEMFEAVTSRLKTLAGRWWRGKTHHTRQLLALPNHAQGETQRGTTTAPDAHLPPQTGEVLGSGMRND